MDYAKLIEEIAAELGGTIDTDNNYFADDERGYKRISLPAIHKWAGISVAYGRWNHKGKIFISLDDHARVKDRSKYWVNDRVNPQFEMPKEIGVSAWKSSKQIATDITRRLLRFDYAAYMAEMETVVEATDARADMRLTNRLALGKIAGERELPTSGEQRLYVRSPHTSINTVVEVGYHGDVSFDLHGIPFGTAKRILEIIMEKKA